MFSEIMISREPIENVIHQGIKRGIEVARDHDCSRAALQLTMCGIDALALVGTPEAQQDVTRDDFIAWAGKYIHLDGPITGLEWYASRCALLHTYGVEAKLTRLGTRKICYFSGLARPYVRVDASISSSLVMVSVEGFIEAFFAGIDRFLIEVFGNPARRPVAEDKLRRCVHELWQGPRPAS